MAFQESRFENQILDLYEQISKLESLRPSKTVNTLFEQLISTCLSTETDIVLEKMGPRVQEIRSNLIKLYGEAEGYLEQHFSVSLGSLAENPINHLHLYPHYTDYLKLTKFEFNLLTQYTRRVPTKIAFVGSGSMPYTSILLAKLHLPNATFYNYDIDAEANSLASRLVSRDPDLSSRMIFDTADILNVTETLRDYDVVFLAALVGTEKEVKVKVIQHLAKNMSRGKLLMLKTVKGPRAFLYPLVDPCDLKGFHVLKVYHPSLYDGFMNSVIVARKLTDG